VGKVLDAKPTGMKERKERRHKPVIRNPKIADLAPYPRAPQPRGVNTGHQPTNPHFLHMCRHLDEHALGGDAKRRAKILCDGSSALSRG
jgi:hypothetical protein